MEIDDSQVNKLEGHIVFLQKYIQKQGNLLLDQIRKSIESEIRIETLSAQISEITGKYEESQKQVELQNDMMQQAANGVETLTAENKTYENTINGLRKSIEDRDKKISDFKNENQSLKDQLDSCRHISTDLKEEYERQKEELNTLFKEFEDFKKSKK